MGIKFHCPNGHKLNVKSFLAGRKAVCPKCGIKVTVPQQSEASTEQASGDAATSATQSKTETGTTVPQPMATAPAQLSPTARPQSSPAPAAESAAFASPQPTLPQPIIPVPMQASLIDPIAEAPTAVWYVRPPSGGQFGPAAGEIMRGWLSEGRVTADSLVWRAGWPDWQSAASAFPQLAGAPTPGVPQVAVVNTPTMPAPATMIPTPIAPVSIAPGPMLAPVMPAGVMPNPMTGAPVFGVPASSDFEDTVGRTRRRRQKGADATMIVSGILVALVVILFIVLGVVLSQQSAEPTPPTPSKPRPKPAASAPEKPRSKPAEKDEPAVEPLEEESAQNLEEMQEP